MAAPKRSFLKQLLPSSFNRSACFAAMAETAPVTISETIRSKRRDSLFFFLLLLHADLLLLRRRVRRISPGNECFEKRDEAAKFLEGRGEAKGLFNRVNPTRLWAKSEWLKRRRLLESLGLVNYMGDLDNLH